MTPVSEGSDTGEATGANASGAKNSSGNLRINTDVTPTIKLNGRGSTAGGAASEDEPLSAASERSDAISGSDLSASEVSGSEMSGSEREPTGKSRAGTSKSADQSIWNGELSAVIGLQKRGLRGLMEGRRLREMGGRELMRGDGSLD
ncbi:MAG: hypothetical protein INR71_05375 [Terriglobus roseus]|nr:hypothetical protein [Terriglobus roseus]